MEVVVGVWSSTWIVYVPGATWVTAVPFGCFRSMVESEPTAPWASGWRLRAVEAEEAEVAVAVGVVEEAAVAVVRRT